MFPEGTLTIIFQKVVLCFTGVKSTLSRDRGKIWRGGDPLCAFKDGETFGDNWMCATVGKIRTLCYDSYMNSTKINGVDVTFVNEQNYGSVNVDDLDLEPQADILWISWYKSRGATDAMWLLSHLHPPRLPTEKELLSIAELYNSKNLI